MKFLCVFVSAIIIFSAGVFVTSKNSTVTFEAIDAYNKETEYTVVLDAGHGGEDGGAVAEDGTVEKEINLNITRNIALLFDLFGINYITVRTEDVSVCDDGLISIRKRKSSDLLNREELVNTTENAILLSIHQNFFTQSQYSGTQVFYSANREESAVLAEKIQEKVRTNLQPDNTREIKKSGDSIYLLYNAKQIAVMVECGFLSNKAELEKLKDPVYNAQLSYCIVTGLIDFLKKDV